MRTQEIYQKAMKFAGEHHYAQKVPGTKANYLLHISNVAMEILMAFANDRNFDVDFALQVAILHDTIEDTSAGYDQLAAEFGEKVAEAVQALTKDNGIASRREKMEDSLRRINLLQKEVGMVKLADRITNLQQPPDSWSGEKIADYQAEAEVISEALQGKNEYLNQRLDQKIREYGRYIRA